MGRSARTSQRWLCETSHAIRCHEPQSVHQAIWSKPFWLIPCWLGLVNSPPSLEPILVEIGMFTGGTIWVLTHGHLAKYQRQELFQPLRGGAAQSMLCPGTVRALFLVHFLRALDLADFGDFVVRSCMKSPGRKCVRLFQGTPKWGKKGIPSNDLASGPG